MNTTTTRKSETISSDLYLSTLNECQNEIKLSAIHTLYGIVEKYTHLANDLSPVKNSKHQIIVENSKKRKKELFSLVKNYSYHTPEQNENSFNNFYSDVDNVENYMSNEELVIDDDFEHLESISLKEIDDEDCIPVSEIDTWITGVRHRNKCTKKQKLKTEMVSRSSKKKPKKLSPSLKTVESDNVVVKSKENGEETKIDDTAKIHDDGINIETENPKGKLKRKHEESKREHEDTMVLRTRKPINYWSFITDEYPNKRSRKKLKNNVICEEIKKVYSEKILNRIPANVDTKSKKQNLIKINHEEESTGHEDTMILGNRKNLTLDKVGKRDEFNKTKSSKKLANEKNKKEGERNSLKKLRCTKNKKDLKTKNIVKISEEKKLKEVLPKSRPTFKHKTELDFIGPFIRDISGTITHSNKYLVLLQDLSVRIVSDLENTDLKLIYSKSIKCSDENDSSRCNSNVSNLLLPFTDTTTTTTVATFNCNRKTKKRQCVPPIHPLLQSIAEECLESPKKQISLLTNTNNFTTPISSKLPPVKKSIRKYINQVNNPVISSLSPSKRRAINTSSLQSKIRETIPSPQHDNSKLHQSPRRPSAAENCLPSPNKPMSVLTVNDNCKKNTTKVKKSLTSLISKKLTTPVKKLVTSQVTNQVENASPLQFRAIKKRRIINTSSLQSKIKETIPSPQHDNSKLHQSPRKPSVAENCLPSPSKPMSVLTVNDNCKKKKTKVKKSLTSLISKKLTTPVKKLVTSEVTNQVNNPVISSLSPSRAMEITKGEIASPLQFRAIKKGRIINTSSLQSKIKEAIPSTQPQSPKRPCILPVHSTLPSVAEECSQNLKKTTSVLVTSNCKNKDNASKINNSDITSPISKKLCLVKKSINLEGTSEVKNLVSSSLSPPKSPLQSKAFKKNVIKISALQSKIIETISVSRPNSLKDSRSTVTIIDKIRHESDYLLKPKCNSYKSSEERTETTNCKLDNKKLNTVTSDDNFKLKDSDINLASNNNLKTVGRQINEPNQSVLNKENIHTNSTITPTEHLRPNTKLKINKVSSENYNICLKTSDVPLEKVEEDITKIKSINFDSDYRTISEYGDSSSNIDLLMLSGTSFLGLKRYKMELSKRIHGDGTSIRDAAYITHLETLDDKRSRNKLSSLDFSVFSNSIMSSVPSSKPPSKIQNLSSVSDRTNCETSIALKKLRKLLTTSKKL